LAFNILTGGAEALYRNLAERNIELLIAGITGVPSEFATEHLFDDSLVVAAGGQNPWTRRRKLKLGELLDEPGPVLPADNATGALAMEAFRASGLEPPRAAVVTLSLNLRIRLLATGCYFSILAGHLMAPPNNYPFLKKLPIELPNLSRPIVI